MSCCAYCGTSTDPRDMIMGHDHGHSVEQCREYLKAALSAANRESARLSVALREIVDGAYSASRARAVAIQALKATPSVSDSKPGGSDAKQGGSLPELPGFGACQEEDGRPRPETAVTEPPICEVCGEEHSQKRPFGAVEVCRSCYMAVEHALDMAKEDYGNDARWQPLFEAAQEVVRNAHNMVGFPDHTMLKFSFVNELKRVLSALTGSTEPLRDVPSQQVDAEEEH